MQENEERYSGRVSRISKRKDEIREEKNERKLSLTHICKHESQHQRRDTNRVVVVEDSEAILYKGARED